MSEKNPRDDPYNSDLKTQENNFAGVSSASNTSSKSVTGTTRSNIQATTTDRRRNPSQSRPKGRRVAEIQQRLTQKPDMSPLRNQRSIERIKDERYTPWNSDEKFNDSENSRLDAHGHSSENIQQWMRGQDEAQSGSSEQAEQAEPPPPATAIEFEDRLKTLEFSKLGYSYAMDKLGQNPKSRPNSPTTRSNSSSKYPLAWSDSEESVYSQETSKTSVPEPLFPIFQTRFNLRIQINMTRILIALTCCEFTAHTSKLQESKPWQFSDSEVQLTYAKMAQYADRAYELAKNLHSDGLRARACYWLGRAYGNQLSWDEAAKAFQNALAFDTTDGEGLSDREKETVQLFLGSVQWRERQQDRDDKLRRRNTGEFSTLVKSKIWRPEVDAALYQADVARAKAGHGSSSTPPPDSADSFETSNIVTPSSAVAESVESAPLKTPEMHRLYKFTEEELEYINYGGEAPAAILRGYELASPREVHETNLGGARRAPPMPIKIPVKRGGREEVRGQDDDKEERRSDVKPDDRGGSGGAKMNLEDELKGLRSIGDDEVESYDGESDRYSSEYGSDGLGGERNDEGM
ncbi:unnamed protein product [Periconia digitata]|uniref:Uncharacterized protein n=1 Tax=Periconia digitata TaxID=1303443 RepID=A0A9W4XVF0_9PLEO|nr:unnamed protein product [Periconia digitata]